ncbi:LysR family transcriptional regulator [Streptomyces malaysiensis subsp. malaysiensis]
MRSGDNVGVELRQIEYFVAVAEESSFTRAAERSQVSQSGLSAAIRSLERELGSSLPPHHAQRATVAGGHGAPAQGAGDAEAGHGRP